MNRPLPTCRYIKTKSNSSEAQCECQKAVSAEHPKVFLDQELEVFKREGRIGCEATAEAREKNDAAFAAHPFVVLG